jgi:hypothetical protein
MLFINCTNAPQCYDIRTLPVLYNPDNTESAIRSSAECAASRYASGHDITEFHNREHLEPFTSYQMLKGSFSTV